MKLIVALGNPWAEYATTRHNLGFLVIDKLAEVYGWTDFLEQKKFAWDVATGMVDKRQVIVLKPQTFMNKSGKSVQAVMQFYKIAPQDILVVHDDIDLEVGKIKLKYAGSHGGHNGIRDIVAQCGTEQFRRLKLGIGRPEDPRHDIVEYVLWKLGKDELLYRDQHLKDVQERIWEYMKNTW